MKATILTSLWAVSLMSAHSAITVAVSGDTYNRNDGTPNSNNNGDTDNELLFGSNGADDNLRPMMSFDISELTNDVATLGGGDYANLTISSATLTVFERRGRGGQTVNILVNRYDFDLNPTTATWNNPDGSGSDSTAGGTIGTNLGSQTVTWDGTADNESATIGLSSSDLVAAIAAAPTTGTLNLLLNTDSPFSNWVSITSDRSTNTARHATLSIDYTVVPEPSTALLSVLAGLGFLARRRR